MDRFDCQLIMGSFVHVYYSSFIRAADPRKLLLSILALKPDEQLLIFNVLKDQLRQRGLLPDPDPVVPLTGSLEDAVASTMSSTVGLGVDDVVDDFVGGGGGGSGSPAEVAPEAPSGF